MLVYLQSQHLGRRVMGLPSNLAIQTRQIFIHMKIHLHTLRYTHTCTHTQIHKKELRSQLRFELCIEEQRWQFQDHQKFFLVGIRACSSTSSLH